MAFVVQDVIEELERSCSLEPLKKLKKQTLLKSYILLNRLGLGINSEFLRH